MESRMTEKQQNHTVLKTFMPVISIIICTYNRGDLLKRCLKSLIEQDMDTIFFEIIVVVDQQFSDLMVPIIHQFEPQRKIRVIIEHEGGHANARNAGYLAANGELLIYLDDDAIAPPQFIRQVILVWDQFAPDIMGGPIYPYYTDKKPGWFRDEYEIRKYEKHSGFSRTCRISGSNFIIRKDTLKSIGLFDKNLGMKKGEIMTLGDEGKVLDTYRLQTPIAEQKVFYSMDVFVYHLVPKWKMNLIYIMKRGYHSGKYRFTKLNNKFPDRTKRQRVNSLIGLFLRMGKTYFNLLRKNGMRNTDHIVALRGFCFYLGYLEATVFFLYDPLSPK